MILFYLLSGFQTTKNVEVIKGFFPSDLKPKKNNQWNFEQVKLSCRTEQFRNYHLRIHFQDIDSHSLRRPLRSARRLIWNWNEAVFWSAFKKLYVQPKIQPNIAHNTLADSCVNIQMNYVVCWLRGIFQLVQN